MKSCELCKFPARTYCESDQASLCWDCDAKVHGANFLVARHLRCLLCQTCQSPTPWRAAGAELGRTVSVCESCLGGGEGAESEAENEDDEMDNTADDESVEHDDDDDADDEEDGDNQVVPWSSVANTPSPASSSLSSEESGGDRKVSESVKASSLKRGRENASDLRTQDLLSLMPSDNLSSASSQQKYGTTLESPWSLEEEAAVSADTMRSWKWKHQRIERDIPVHFQSCVISPPAVSSLKRLGSKNLGKESHSFDLNT
ncbi:hypothetical protein SLEP1_g22689 [Rubroshorea leprosula]|uniref:B box-type domain-containing protein n=1 Tax=Rubroshorea leprosula TaxID=152421 RepID=A0AAV5JG06_9ROSI|nr:hypothetical protein SLEP1_g22689 [Rubroshorea leprosula]